MNSPTPSLPTADRPESPRQIPVAVLDGLDAIVWEIDPRTWQFTFVSAGAERILGYPRAQWTSEADFWQTHTHPDDRERAFAFSSDCVSQGTDHELEYRMIAADGRAVWLRDIVHVVPGADAAALELHGVMIDVTKQKTMEAALRASEDRFSCFAEASVDGIIIHEMGRIVDSNGTADRMLGYAPGELAGRMATELTVPEERERMLAHIRSGSEAAVQGHAVRRDGTTFPVEVRPRNLVVRGASRRFVVVRDITERLRTEVALHDTEQQLRQAQKLEAVGRLAGGVAHDFNNLLTVITVFTQLVIDGLAASDPRQGDLREVAKAARRAGDLTRQLLAFSRKQVMRSVVLDLNDVVRDVETMLRRVIGEDVRLDTQFQAGAASVLADRGQIEQVLMNLVVNARDAMPAGGTLTTSTGTAEVDDAFVRRHAATDLVPGRYVRLDVTDTGIGMDDGVKARIFEPFFTTKPSGSGTGLGLSTVYGIVTQSNGCVLVRSAPREGATFSVYLPAVAPARDPDAARVEREYRKGTETILLVEDEDSVRDVARRILEAAGYAVVVARNGLEALEIASTTIGEIDLLLTDLVMPGLGGRELAERLVRDRPRTRVLFMSGYTEDAAVHRGFMGSTVDFLAKPFTVEKLTSHVRAVLDAQR
jgi:PAS domain S-box-containing protein